MSDPTAGPASESVLARLAGTVSCRRRVVVAAWLVLRAAGGWFALHQTDHLSGGGWDVAGSESVQVGALLKDFPGATAPALTLFVTGSTPASVQKRLAAVMQRYRHRGRGGVQSEQQHDLRG